MNSQEKLFCLSVKEVEPDKKEEHASDRVLLIGDTDNGDQGRSMVLVSEVRTSLT